MALHLLSAMVTIVTIMTMSATASCDCLIPISNTSTLNAQDFTAIFNQSSSDAVRNNYDALNQAMSLLNISFTPSQLAAFLGIVHYNTDSLKRHRARCADSDTCSGLYDQTCSNRTVNDSRRFYPRSALMISYQCNYGDIDSVLRSSLPCIKSIEQQPDLLSDRLLYSYLASLVAWTQTDCMSITQDNLDQLPRCVQILNPWLCTEQGLDDRRRLTSSVNAALVALNLTDLRRHDQMSCNNMLPESHAVLPQSSSNLTLVNVTQSNTNQNYNRTQSPISNLSSSLDVTPQPVQDFVLDMLTRNTWRSFFSIVNLSVADSHYDAFVSAMIVNGIENLDQKQAALLLSTISMRTSNLTDVQVNVTIANRVRVSVEVIVNLLSRGLSSDFVSRINPDLVMFYMDLIGDVIASDCMDYIRQGLYELCLGELFPQDTCFLNATVHDDIVGENERALLLLNAEHDLSLFKCNHDDMTSNAVLSSPLSVIAIMTISFVMMI